MFGAKLPTVKSHVTNILKKLGVSGRRDLLPGDGEEQL
ncbi:LuxR C-terminal-related transcriptional regulator [Rubrobacter xylanophilus]